MAKFSVRGLTLINRAKTFSEALEKSQPDDDIVVNGREKENGLFIKHSLQIEGQNMVKMKVPEHAVGFVFEGNGSTKLSHFDIQCKEISNAISINSWVGELSFEDIVLDYNTKRTEKRYPLLSSSSLGRTSINILNSSMNNVFLGKPDKITVDQSTFLGTTAFSTRDLYVSSSTFEHVNFAADKYTVNDTSFNNLELDGKGKMNNVTVTGELKLTGNADITNIIIGGDNSSIVLNDGKFLFRNSDLRSTKITATNAEIIVEKGTQMPKNIEKENTTISNNTGTTKEGEGLKELNDLIGLTPVKNTINGYVNLAKMNILRKQNGLDTTDVSLHMIFAGSPGTGKTTVAKIVGRILREQGLVKNTNFVAVSQKDIIGQYEGEAPANMSKYIQQAMGGILFIDEAYSLLPDNSGSTGGHYGEQALNQLTDDMEKYHNDVVVILAGYSDSMHDFLKRANPGLASRFATWVEFPDYSVNELYKIAQYQLKKQQLITNDKVNGYIYSAIKNFHEVHMIDGNGRFIRNFMQRVIMALSNRVAQSEVLNKEDLLTLTVEDVQNGYKEYAQELIKKKRSE